MEEAGLSDQHQRFTDDLAPVAVGAALTYPGVTTLPKRRAPLLSSDGQQLGWVWTDGVTAAGWEPAEQTRAAVQAGAKAWAVAAAAARADEPVTAVLESERYRPDYALGEPA